MYQSISVIRFLRQRHMRIITLQYVGQDSIHGVYTRRTVFVNEGNGEKTRWVRSILAIKSAA